MDIKPSNVKKSVNNINSTRFNNKETEDMVVKLIKGKCSIALVLSKSCFAFIT